MPACKALTKPKCATKAKDCLWIVGKGCQDLDDVPLKLRVPTKATKAAKPSSATACKPKKKDACAKAKDCMWIVGKGCHDIDDVPLKLRMPKKK